MGADFKKEADDVAGPHRKVGTQKAGQQQPFFPSSSPSLLFRVSLCTETAVGGPSPIPWPPFPLLSFPLFTPLLARPRCTEMQSSSLSVLLFFTYPGSPGAVR